MTNYAQIRLVADFGPDYKGQWIWVGSSELCAIDQFQMTQVAFGVVRLTPVGIKIGDVDLEYVSYDPETRLHIARRVTPEDAP